MFCLRLMESLQRENISTEIPSHREIEISLSILPPFLSPPFCVFYAATLRTTKFESKVFWFQGDSQPMEHEPCCLLRDSQSAMEFPARDAIFAANEHPHGRQPFLERDRRILKNGSYLGGVISPLAKISGINKLGLIDMAKILILSGLLVKYWIQGTWR